MQVTQLQNVSKLGEKLSEEDIDELMTDCLDEENDEGEIEYTRKYLFHFLNGYFIVNYVYSLFEKNV